MKVQIIIISKVGKVVREKVGPVDEIENEEESRKYKFENFFNFLEFLLLLLLVQMEDLGTSYKTFYTCN